MHTYIEYIIYRCCDFHLNTHQSYSIQICSVEEVNCVAKWKDGSTFYFLGLLNHSHVQANDYEGRFRCFAYSSFYNGFHLAQSGEAKCNLPNAKEGDRIMELKRGSFLNIFNTFRDVTSAH